MAIVCTGIFWVARSILSRAPKRFKTTRLDNLKKTIHTKLNSDVQRYLAFTTTTTTAITLVMLISSGGYSGRRTGSVKVKCAPCTRTEALYRPYGP